LIFGGDGNLYGTTSSGGEYGAGSIFRVSTEGSLLNLYSFPPATNGGHVGFDLGVNGLALGTNGNFYGTTEEGGTNFTGSIFVVSPSGAFTNLHSFAAEAVNPARQASSPDGENPSGALALGADGNFYGTTEFGGANNTGTIFRLTPDGMFTSVHSFAKLVNTSTNGAVPNALTAGADGALYGTTKRGGIFNAGTFFKFTPDGNFTQIASFNGAAPSKSPVTPDSTLTQDAGGNFYGTSSGGGLQGGGTVFEITAQGNVTLLYSFPLLNAGAGATVSLDTNGIFYGTTAASGVNGQGTVFRLTTNGEFSAYRFSVLNTNSANAEGANPLAGLTLDKAGNFFGVCAAGGTNGSGTVFEIPVATFFPPVFLASSNAPPASTNLLVGSTIAFTIPADGIGPLTYQWTRNGIYLTDGGEISEAGTSNLMINPVLYGDVGSYALVVSNIWGALTSSVTVLTVKSPSIAIVSPTMNARTSAPIFSGTATPAPLITNADPSTITLTNVTFTISNLLNGSNITGVAVLSGGAAGVSNWVFDASPSPGTNIISVQAEDASGNLSPVATRTFFFVAGSALTVLERGSGAATFTITNGTMLNVGQSYTITARPISSVFSNWVGDGLTNLGPTFVFVMKTNLVLTADLLSRQPPTVSIAFPGANARTATNVFLGTAASSPLLPGVNPTNLPLSGVSYWLTNAGALIASGTAMLTPGGAISNWSITVAPGPGTNILAVQSQDVSGGLSRVVSQKFFYESPTPFTLLAAGNGTGTFVSSGTIAGDVPPTNGALLNIGETYRVTAKPGKFSRFTGWSSTTGLTSANATQTFSMQPGFGLTATFTEIPPVVSITAPAANARLKVPNFSGRASGNFPIASVNYTLANGLTGAVSSGTAILGGEAGTSATWTIPAVPQPGTNTLTVSCTDTNGTQSAAVSRRFFYVVESRLTVTNGGLGAGTFKGTASVAGDAAPANGAMLNIGEGYAITAIPDSGSLFSNWVNSASGAATSTAMLRFTMESNLVLTAVFATNFYPAAAGTYNGLFYPADGVSEETSGMIYNLALQKTGAFSGKVLLGGASYNMASTFDASSNAAATAGPLQLALTLNEAAQEITGTVSGPNGMASLTAEKSPGDWPSAEYTLLLAPLASVGTNSPPGDGYALITNRAGVLTISGALADGTAYSQTVPVAESGDAPIYAQPYGAGGKKGAGLLLGWINLTNLEGANSLTWIKKPSRATGFYTSGFTNLISVTGAVWTNAPDLTLSNETLTLSNGNVVLTFTNVVVSHGTLTNLGAEPTNFVSGTVNPKNGLLSVTFATGAKAKTKGAGALLQNTGNGGGFFLGTTNAGAVILQPAPQD
jgi:uncharacterized repeat protein (TIGR03803 family)